VGESPEVTQIKEAGFCRTWLAMKSAASRERVSEVGEMWSFNE
jgi:hypothetical protein